MPLPQKAAPEKIKKFRLPGARAFIDSLTPWAGEPDRQRRIYLDRLEQMLAAQDALGIITTAAAYETFILATQTLRQPATEWPTLLRTKGALPEIAIIAPTQDNLSKGILIRAEEDWAKYFSALTGDLETEAQSKVATQQAKQEAIRKFQDEQLATENKRISGEQERQAKVGQWRQQQSAQSREAQLADVRQWNTLMGANQGQETGVLGAFNMAGLGGGQERWQKAAMQSSFEDWRHVSLRQLTGTANWIRRWEIQHMPNPYQTEEPTPLGEASEIVGRLESEVERLDSLAELYPAGSAPSGSELDQLIQAIPVARADLQGQLTEWQATKQRLLATPFSDFRAPTELVQMTPPAPGKLAELVPSFRAGQPIWKGAQVPTPSMQQWGRMIPSEQEMFGGFLNWSQGAEGWADIIAKTKQMLPESPGLGGRGSWSPARQGR